MLQTYITPLIILFLYIIFLALFYYQQYLFEQEKLKFDTQRLLNKEKIKLKQLEPIIERDGRQLYFSGKLLKCYENYGIITGKTERMFKDGDKVIRSRKLYFDLPDGQIISEGLSKVYDQNGILLDSHTTTIIGGTHKYLDKIGHIKTEYFKDNNEYIHTITIY